MTIVSLRFPPAPFSPPACTGQFFELDVYHSDGTPLTSDQIFVQLEKIWNSSLQTNKEPVGILTSNHRNSWAKAYNTLIKGVGIEPLLTANVPTSNLHYSWARAYSTSSEGLLGWGPTSGPARLCFSLNPLNSAGVVWPHFTDEETEPQLG